MTTDRPDDRADERYMTNDELDQFIAAISDPLYKSGFKDGYNRGLLATPERDHAQERAELAEKDRRSAHFDAARALAERDQLRAQVAAVRAQVAVWRADANEYLNRFGQHLPCSLECCIEHIEAALDTAGGEQHGE